MKVVSCKDSCQDEGFVLLQQQPGVNSVDIETI